MQKTKKKWSWYIDLENACNQVHWEWEWISCALRKGTCEWHDKIIEHIYDERFVSLSCCKVIKEFLVVIGLNQGWTLSLYLFALIMEMYKGYSKISYLVYAIFF